MPTLEKQILSDLAELYHVVEEHITLDKGNCQKIEAMYKIIVTGTNGTPSVPETVRRHSDWIMKKDEEAEEKEKRGFELKKGIILLAVGQVFTLIVGAVAILKR